jgi:hypothetical protein
MGRLVIRAVSRWLHRAPVSVDDLARFRIAYAITALAILPTAGFGSALPAASFSPPPGPLLLLESYPPVWVVGALEVMAALALGMLALGWRTATASVSAGVLLLVVSGLANSFGQVNHVALIAVVPLVLAASGWGGRLSLDARAGRPARRRPWTLRALAVAIALAYATSAIPKVEGGWLSPASQAAQGHLNRRLFTGEPGGLLAEVGRMVGSPMLWEAVDIGTIVIELGLVVAVLSWRTFRFAVAVATLFHLAILLTLGIAFATTVLAYGAFVTWGRWRPAGRLRFALPRSAIAIPVVAALSVSAVAIAEFLPGVQDAAETLVVVLGAAAGGAFLITVIGRATRALGSLEPDRPSVAGRRLGAALFGVVLLALPAQLVLTPRFGEPYPALQGPSFPQVRLADGILTSRNIPFVSVDLADGTTVPLSVGDVVPESGASRSAVFRTLFRDKEVARDPSTVAWLRSRLDAALPGADVVKFRVLWSTVLTDADDGSRIAVETKYDVVVDFRSHG